MRLREFLALQEVEEAEGNLDQEVTGLNYDSRQVRAGEIFFAIPGEKLDGHEFIPQALKSGAAAVVVAHKATWPQDATWIRTKDVRRTMRQGRPARIISFGFSEVDEGVFAKSEEIVWRGASSEERFPLRHELEIPFSRAAEALGAFSGIHRRFEIKGEPRGITVIDDYGHHPAEVRATIGAIRESWKRPLVVIFQPHRYSRTRDLFDDFLTAFEGADRLVLTEVYPAGEDPIPGATGETLYQAIKRKGHLDVEFVADKSEIVKRLTETLNPGDVVLTLGAGDIYKVGEAVVEALQ